ncbi:MAG: Spi family protease inhibitor, partial [Bacteroidales bacterium]|nr:Spi family protease inhibitor [Bacteroidales bacterium]
MKKTIFLVIFLVLAVSLQAKKVGLSTAKTVAEKYYSGFVMKNAVNTPAILAYTDRVTLSGEKVAIPCFYVFNIDRGFVIVSADDRVAPILAYSTESNFDAQNIPENVRFFLDGYRQEISSVPAMDAAVENPDWEMLKNGEVSCDKDATVVVGPLLRTKWHQENIYNSKCPVDSAGPGGHAYVGCGAIVMGQLMRYW